jgi:mevalonate kinase
VADGVDTDPLRRARDVVLQAAGWTGEAPHVTTRATLPLACGLGSSAAFSVALVRAVLAGLGQPATPAEVRPLANLAEAVFHGNPSGVDVATVLSDVPIRFRRGGEPVAVRVGGTFHLWIVDTTIRSSTAEVVASVAALRQRDPAAIDGHFTTIAEAVELGISSIAEGSIDGLAAAMDAAMLGLRGIGVSHPSTEVVIDRARRRGALSGKLSGAGRGGVVLLLAADDRWDPGPTVAGCPVLTRATLRAT